MSSHRDQFRRELEGARRTTSDMRRDINESGRTTSISPTDELEMRAALARELASGASDQAQSKAFTRGGSISIDIDTLRKEESLIRGKLERVQQERTDNVMSLKDNLFASLQQSRAQIAEYRERNHELKEQLEREIASREQAESDRNAAEELVTHLEAQLDQKIHENAALAASAGSSAHSAQDADAMLSAALQRVEISVQERDLANAKVAALESTIAKNSGSLGASVGDLSIREVEMRDEIRELQELRADAMKGQIEELEEERGRWQKLAAELETKLRKAQLAIDHLGSRQGTSTARQEEAERERQQALDEMALLRKEIGHMRQESHEMQRALAET